MKIGVPAEIKTHEYRVGLTPLSVRILVDDGHTVLVQSGAGRGIGADDTAYRAAGARIAESAAAVFDEAAMIVKVKEPQASERRLLRPGQTLFTYLHLAPDADQVRELLASGATAIAYETVTASDGSLPLLAPMSEVAGRMAIQVAAHFLERPQGGRGVLMSGAQGVAPCDVLILGAGVVGTQAALVAAGMGANVTVLNRSRAGLERLAEALSKKGIHATLLEAVAGAIERRIEEADAVIGAALVPGALAPKLVTRAMLARMRTGAVIVDVSIDQGGCCETSRPTTHTDPVYEIDGVLHYCVANMPGAVPRTSTEALNRVTLPRVRAIARLGAYEALLNDEHLCAGLNIHAGHVTRREIADALGLSWLDARTALQLA